VECAEHGVVVEQIPWSEGKRPVTRAMMGFLARWGLYRSEFALLQFSTEHGQMLGVAIACGQFLTVFHTVHLLSISYRKMVIFGGTD
jgi:hypothetical protein